MRKIVFFLTLIVFSLHLAAQEIVPKEICRNGICKVGLYNARTEQWIVNPAYKRIQRIGTYNGVTYWAIQSKDTELWGVIRSSDLTQFHIAMRFSDIKWANTGYFSTLPIVCVRKGNNCGIMEIGTDSCYYYASCKYAQAYWEYSDKIVVKDWNGDYKYFSATSLGNWYRNKEQYIANKQKNEHEQKARKDSIERAEKEKKLASFTLYAKDYVTPKVNAWQQKDEFETIAEYKERVTGEKREQKIRELSKEAENLFIAEHKKLDPIGKLTLEPYDAENGVFSVRSSKFGQLLVPVPRANGEANAFRAHFDGDMLFENPTYFIDNEKIALKSLEFHDTVADKKYYYSNQSALNYQQYAIDPDALDLAPVRITSSTTTAPPDTKMVKPVCTILSPHTGSTFCTPTIRLKYQITVDPRTTASVHFFVADREVQPIDGANEGVTPKGARVVEGIEVELPMRKEALEAGRETAVSVQLVDGTGTWAERKTIFLTYAGEKPKPTLHVLAIGVSDYEAGDLQTLNYAAKDAQDFVQTISSSDLSMYKEIKPTLLVNQNATTRRIQRELSQLTSRVSQGDVIMLFFSGHGIVHNKERYFMTSDASAEEYYNGLEFDFIRKRMTEMSEDKQCRVLVFMDACHSGAMAGTKGSLSDITFATPGVIGFYSSTAGEQSAELDKLQNGVFTRVLLDGLKGGAKDAEGRVTLHLLDAYIKSNVKAKTNGKQTPIVENVTGDAVLFHIKK